MMKEDMSIIKIPVISLIPYARNARTHSDEQVAQIAASIREFGWTNPVLVDGEKGIIAGHGRVLAARKLGLEEVPCIELSHLTETQRRAYILADNKLALNAEWDLGSLATELIDLDSQHFDLDLTGFSSEEIEQIMQWDPGLVDGLTDPDDVPQLEDSPVSKPGDLWILGKHRLICGDSSEAHIVESVLKGVRPHLMVTDPPYGVEYDPAWRVRARKNSTQGEALGVVMNDNRCNWTEVWALFPGDVAYVWHSALHTAEVQASLEASGFRIRTQIIWAKNNLVLGRGNYHWQHEPCWYAVRDGKKGHWAGDRKQSTIWRIDKPLKSETGHSTQKPVDCMKKPIENNSSPGQAVYEPFSGSGTTIIASEQAGRSCLAIEVHPPYVDMAVRRWQNFTGKVGILEQTGGSFAQTQGKPL